MALILIALIALTAYIIAGSFRAREHRIQQEDTPLDIVKKRYASGEITRDQYDRLRNDLSGK